MILLMIPVAMADDRVVTGASPEAVAPWSQNSASKAEVQFQSKGEENARY
jgi:hypothetical protein